MRIYRFCVVALVGFVLGGVGPLGVSSGQISSAGAATSVSPIAIGTICSCSGAGAAIEGGVGRAITAWVDSVNAQGGIDGHKVKLFAKDDGTDPATSLADVQQLVQTDHVVAIVSDQSEEDSDWASYVSTAGVPVIGGLNAGNLSFLTNADFYPAGAQTIQMLYGSVALAHKLNKNKLALMYCAEGTECAETIPLYQLLTKQLGMQDVYSAKVSSTASDYTAPCLAAQSSGADSLAVAAPSSTVLRIIEACAEQGYKPLILSDDGSVTQEWLTTTQADGTQVSEVNYPYFSSQLPAAKAMFQALNKYAPGLVHSSLFNSEVSYAWDAGQLFLAAAKAAKLGANATAAEVKIGLYSLKNETLGGLAPPLTFSPGKVAFPLCYFSFSIEKKKFTLGNGGKDTCIPPADAAPLQKLLSS